MNPYFRMRMYFKPEEFYGSHAIIAQLLEGISALPQPKSFELIGLPGVGKTTLLRYLAHPEGAFARFEHRQYLSEPFRERRYWVFPIHVEFRLLPSDMSAFAYLYHCFSEEYQEYQRRREELRLPQDLAESAILGTEVKSLEKACADLDKKYAIRPVFLLDDFDLPFKGMSEDETSRLRPFRPFVAFIIATEQRLDRVNPKAAGSPFFYNLGIVEYKGLDPKDAGRLVEEPAEKAKYPFPQTDRDIILEQAALYPSLLFRGCETLWELRHKFDLKPDAPLPDEYKDVLFGRLRAEFQHAFRLYWERLNEVERTALISLAQNPEQLTSAERQTLDLLEKERGLVVYNPDRSRYEFFSPLFAEFVCEMTEAASAGLIPALTGLELKLYEYLRDHADHICTFEELHRGIWNHSMGESEEDREQAKRRVQVAISRLRNKLRERTGEEIISIRDEGYRLIPRVSAENQRK